MSDPGFITSLTEAYLEMVKSDEQKEQEQNRSMIVVESDEDIKDGVKTLENIISPEDVAIQLNKQVEAGNYAVIVIDGMQGSGKSVLARSLTHKFEQLGFAYVYSSGFDIFDAPEKFIAMAQTNKNIFAVIDDVSYAFGGVSGKASSRMKNFIGTIRHQLGGARVVLCIVTHTVGGIPPILKNSLMWIFSQPNLSEYDIMARLTGRSQKAKERLDKTFAAVTDMQAKGLDQGFVVIRYKRRRYRFEWGTKESPGDGRLMLAIINGKPSIYNSIDEYCDNCKSVAFTPVIDKRNYINLNPTEEQQKDSKERGTQ